MNYHRTLTFHLSCCEYSSSVFVLAALIKIYPKWLYHFKWASSLAGKYAHAILRNQLFLQQSKPAISFDVIQVIH